jgi:hypothetical protein
MIAALPSASMKSQSVRPRGRQGSQGQRIEYEPDFLPDGRKIDFAADLGEDSLYVEVKTDRHKRVDSEGAWQKYLYLKQFHPETVDWRNKGWLLNVILRLIRQR